LQKRAFPSDETPGVPAGFRRWKFAPGGFFRREGRSMNFKRRNFAPPPERSLQAAWAVECARSGSVNAAFLLVVPFRLVVVRSCAQFQGCGRLHLAALAGNNEQRPKNHDGPVCEMKNERQLAGGTRRGREKRPPVGEKRREAAR
jgi:hypothetical protein